MLLLAAGCDRAPERREPQRRPWDRPRPSRPPTPSQPAPGPEARAVAERDHRPADDPTSDRPSPNCKRARRVATTRITARDPITLPGNAYVTIIGRTSILNIQHAIDLYQAENGRYPKDYDEFMTEIIKANNIALPKLPHYQKYGYDEKEHKLIILQPRRADTTHHP